MCIAGILNKIRADRVELRHFLGHQNRIMERTIAKTIVMAKIAIMISDVRFFDDFLPAISLQLCFNCLCQVCPDAFDLRYFFDISSEDVFDGTKML